MSKKGTWKQAFLSFGLAILVILTIRWALFEPYVIPSGSMIPTLLIHDHILVNKFAYGIRVPFASQWLVPFNEPARGDVVVFRSLDNDGFFMVKRVIGVGGDTVLYDPDGQLFINGQPVSQRELSPEAADLFLSTWSERERQSHAHGYVFQIEALSEKSEHLVMRSRMRIPVAEGPYTIPEGSLFLMGDNRDNSTDSRVWGEIPVRKVLGKALFVWLSCEETLPDAPSVCDPQTIRWNRMFKTID